MNADQARDLVRQKSLESSAGRGSESPVGRGSARTNEIDTLGALDPNETSMEAGPSGRQDTARPQQGAGLRRPPKDTATPDSLLRYGRRIFKNADPSMFASFTGAVGSNYQMGPGDEMILTLWGQKEARYQLTLDRDGQVSVEGIGVVSLNGKTLKGAEDLLKKRLSRIYSGLSTGQASLDITLGKLKRIRVFVVGDVVNPGGYLLSGNTSVLAALFQAKGPSDLGTERVVQINRGGLILKVDLYEYFFNGKRPAGDVLQDGDVVRVPRKGMVVRARGDVGNPGWYELLPSEDARDLLEYAGGLKATAASTSLSVLRTFEDGRRDVVALPSPQALLKGGETAFLQDDDVVTVQPGRDPSRRTVHVRGEVRFPGNYPWSEGVTAGKILQLAGGPGLDAYLGRGLVERIERDGSRSQWRIALDSASALPLRPLDTLTVFHRGKMLFQDSVVISGAVRNPGKVPYRNGMTVKDLILSAGGFLRWAEFGKVRLENLRQDNDSILVEILDLDSNLSVASADRAVSAFGHVSVPYNPQYRRMETVTVRGHVAHPGTYALQFPEERLSSLLVRCGGPRPEGYMEAARLFRAEDSTGRIAVDFPEVLKKPGSITDLPLRDGDTIDVPRRPATVKVDGRVRRPSNVVWVEGKDWKWYVAMAGGFADSANTDGVYVQYANGSIETRDGGFRTRPNPGSVVTVPMEIPEKVSFGETIGGINAILATVVAGLTIFVLLNSR
jgi:protein involved in polysaccharide export with SLBB domain